MYVSMLSSDVLLLHSCFVAVILVSPSFLPFAPPISFHFLSPYLVLKTNRQKKSQEFHFNTKGQFFLDYHPTNSFSSSCISFCSCFKKRTVAVSGPQATYGQMHQLPRGWAWRGWQGPSQWPHLLCVCQGSPTGTCTEGSRNAWSRCAS